MSDRPTKEQIERVARWLRERGFGGDIKVVYHDDGTVGLWAQAAISKAGGIIYKGGWPVFAVIAEACKASNLLFNFGESNAGWGCDIGIEGESKFSECAAHASILALDAYLVSKEQPNE